MPTCPGCNIEVPNWSTLAEHLADEHAVSLWWLRRIPPNRNRPSVRTISKICCGCGFVGDVLQMSNHLSRQKDLKVHLVVAAFTRR